VNIFSSIFIRVYLPSSAADIFLSLCGFAALWASGKKRKEFLCDPMEGLPCKPVL